MKETGLATKKSNRPGFYAKQGLVVLKMRMSLDQRSIYIYVAIYSYSPAPFGSLEAENVLGPTIYIYICSTLQTCLPPLRLESKVFLKEPGGIVEKTRTVYKDELEWKA